VFLFFVQLYTGNREGERIEISATFFAINPKKMYPFAGEGKHILLPIYEY